MKLKDYKLNIQLKKEQLEPGFFQKASLDAIEQWDDGIEESGFD
jgi:hypothetical protein